jgi:hypothetical protein
MKRLVDSIGARLTAAALLIVLLAASAAPAHAAAYIAQSSARVSGVAGETLAEGDAAAIKAADGLVYKADADDSTLRPALGFIGKGGASGVDVEVVTRGTVAGLSSLTKGAVYYLSATAGATTATAVASYPQKVGVATSATTLNIDIGSPATVVADSAVTTGKIAANAVTSTKASTPLVTKTVLIAVENLAAGVDIGDGTAANARVVWRAPTALTIGAVKIVGFAAAAGIDATNTAVIKVYHQAQATPIVTKTYNNVTTWPASGTFDDLGTPDATEKVFASGDVLRFDIVNGTTADPPAFLIQIDYTTTD